MENRSTGDESKPVPIAGGPLVIALASLRNTEATLRWQGAQWVFTLNSSAGVAILYRLFFGSSQNELLWLGFGCAAVAGLNFAWYHVLRRDGKLFSFWNEKITEHEEINGIEGGVHIFTSPQYKKLSNARNRLQRNLERLTVVLIYLWAFAALWLCARAFIV